MGFYIRKSIRLGPVRFNLSRSGIGTSVGVKGFRVGVGPKGKYVHAGRGGLYYRQSLEPPRKPLPFSPTQNADQEVDMQEIESAHVSELTDDSSAALLSELNRVQKRWQLFPVALTATLVLMAFNADKGVGLVGIAVVGVLVSIYARHLDVTKGTVILDYKLEPKAEKLFSELKEGFMSLAGSERIWNIKASGENHDLKRQAGAGRIIERTKVAAEVSKPRRLVCNVDVPSIPAGKEMLYFFPDRILVYTKHGVGAVSYGDLDAQIGQKRFIESDPVPSDAEVVDQTWQYVNKSGGPDRRFSNNRELPIALYGELTITSGKGLNELFQFSSKDAGSKFADALMAIHKYDPSYSIEEESLQSLTKKKSKA